MLKLIATSAVILAICIGGLAPHAWAQITIDFETLPDGTTPSAGNQIVAYRDLGVTFHNAMEIVPCGPEPADRWDPITFTGSNCVEAKSGRFVVRPLFNTEFSRRIINIEFVKGQTFVTAFVRLDESERYAGKEVTVVMRAFDGRENFLRDETVRFIHDFSDGEWHPITFVMPTSLPGVPKIRRVEIWGGLTENIGPQPDRSRASNFLLIKLPRARRRGDFNGSP